MTWFNALQGLLAAASVLLIARRMRALLFEGSVDFGAFSIALEEALAAGQLALARTIAEACMPAWPARLAAAGLADVERGRARLALEEELLQLEAAASSGLTAIVACGRMASPLAFIGVIIEIGGAFGGSSGLLGLQRGLPASIALERALFTFAAGAATFAVCFAGATILQRRARVMREQLRKIAAAVARADVR